MLSMIKLLLIDASLKNQTDLCSSRISLETEAVSMLGLFTVYEIEIANLS